MSATELRPEEQELAQAFDDFYRNYYRDEIGDLAQHYPQERESLFIEASDVYRWDPDVLEDWRDSPERVQRAAEDGLSRFDLPIDLSDFSPTVRLTDSNETLPRRQVTDINPQDDIGRYVAVSGQIGRITGKKPRLKTAVFVCQRCGTPTRIPQSRTDVQEPHECQGCERDFTGSIDGAQSEFVNQRKVKLEEPIGERSQARGQSLPVYVEGDLCDYGPGDSTLPDHAGETVTVLGVVNVDESQLQGRNADPETDYWIDAKAFVFEEDTENDIDIEAHRDTFEDLAARDDAVDTVAESLAPSLHAEEGDDLYVVRRAIAAWLFNGYRIDPDGAGSKRGDIHMCLVGDPGTGKSTLMGYVDDVLPKSEFRTGTGLTEVGLTAAAVQEEFAGQTEWTLQPGILPRADGGHCLIDEIDGVVDENTKAIHDALEGDQMVKTDKAGIKADLPTRTAVLVGGNPTYTRFDRHEPLVEQIDLDPALFDRMDLVFAMQDEVDAESDANKAEHALNAWDDLSQAEVAERVGQATPEGDAATDPPVSQNTLRAWIAYARRNVFPTLTPDVKDRLQDFYVEVRDLNDGYHTDDGEAAVPATARTLEAGIRLSMAFARLHLSDTVELRHAEQAIELTKEVVGLTFDPETGEFDDQLVKSGMPKSQRDRVKAVEDIVADLQGKGPAPIEDVIERATDGGMDEHKAEHEIEKLKEQGQLYEPQTGAVRTT